MVARAELGTPLSRQVQRDHAGKFRQVREQSTIGMGRATRAVQQQDQRAIAAFLNMPALHGPGDAA